MTFSSPKEKQNFSTPEHRLAAQLRAWEMRVQAYTYEKIGKELGCTGAHAHNLVKEYSAALKEASKETAEQLRDMEISKLDAAENRLWEALDKQRSNLTVDQIGKASEKIVKISESRRKLTGLDAPQRVELGGNIYTVQATSPDCAEWGEPPKPSEKKDDPDLKKELTDSEELW